MALTPDEIATRKAFREWTERSAKWNGYQITTERFGTLMWQDTWKGAVNVPLFASRFELSIDVYPKPELLSEDPPPPPGEWAIELWNEFCSDWGPSRRDEAIDALHSLLPALAKPWLEHITQEEFDDYGHDIVKHIQSRERFVETLCATELGLNINQDYKWVDMWFETGFDPEHGLELGYVLGRPGLKATSGGDFHPSH